MRKSRITIETVIFQSGQIKIYTDLINKIFKCCHAIALLKFKVKKLTMIISNKLFIYPSVISKISGQTNSVLENFISNIAKLVEFMLTMFECIYDCRFVTLFIMIYHNFISGSKFDLITEKKLYKSPVFYSSAFSKKYFFSRNTHKRYVLSPFLARQRVPFQIVDFL